MDNTQYFIDKSSGTSADTLLAIGFASLLGEIHQDLYGTQEGILIQDTGSYYAITLPMAIRASDLQKLSKRITMVLPLDSGKQREKQSKRGENFDGFPYDEQMEQSRVHRERIKQLSPKLQRPEARLMKAPELLEIISDEPDTKLTHYQTVIQMKIASSFNELGIRWAKLNKEQQYLHISILLTLFSNPYNDLASAIAEWEKLAHEHHVAGNALVSALQIINPATGKGANRTKSSILGEGNQESFWLVELLKFKGFMDAAAPLVIKESKDRKTYVIQPETIDLSTLQRMMREFRAVFWPTTAVKLDIIASLRFAQVLVEHRKTTLERNIKLKPWQKPRVISVCQGFDVTFYKDMGSAYATMNIASINLPAWLPEISTVDEAKAVLSLLDEHVHLIQNIRNSKGEEGAEEFELLRFYRDFLSGRDLRPFWKFTTAYSSYLISQRERERNPTRQIRQLSMKGLRTIVMNTQNEELNLVEILDNPGFQNIADSIRRSTVTAQFRRNQGGDRTYEIRYGLGQELMRKARYPKEFMVVLCNFLFRYNAETAQKEEKAVKSEQETPFRRGMTRDDDLKAIAQLIDKFGSELICSMLIACGYSLKGSSTNASRETDHQSSSESEE